MINSQHQRVFFFAPVLMFAFAYFVPIPGCGSKQTTLTPTIAVRGRILLDDVPLAGARVTFIPIAPIGSSLVDMTPMSYGVTDAEGKYALQQADGTVGVTKGQHTVIISKPIKQDKDRKNGLEPVTDAVPDFYRQHGYLKRHVMPMPGGQQIDFRLSTIDPLLKNIP